MDAPRRVDMLINNAGIGMRTVNPRLMGEPLRFWLVPIVGFRAVIATNLTGYFSLHEQLRRECWRRAVDA
jgi:NAD(P)-dependent dehydrogenase (short-subunit alcohol dehydrogenase family)